MTQLRAPRTWLAALDRAPGPAAGPGRRLAALDAPVEPADRAMPPLALPGARGDPGGQRGVLAPGTEALVSRISRRVFDPRSRAADLDRGAVLCELERDPLAWLRANASPATWKALARDAAVAAGRRIMDRGPDEPNEDARARLLRDGSGAVYDAALRLPERGDRWHAADVAVFLAGRFGIRGAQALRKMLVEKRPPKRGR